MIIDCDSCAVRDTACGECVIGALLGSPGPRTGTPDGAEAPSGAPIVQLDAPERRAIAVLADQGLVPRLRLVASEARRASRDPDTVPPVRDAG